jgi:hypothetical protein
MKVWVDQQHLQVQHYLLHPWYWDTTRFGSYGGIERRTWRARELAAARWVKRVLRLVGIGAMDSTEGNQARNGESDHGIERASWKEIGLLRTLTSTNPDEITDVG